MIEYHSNTRREIIVYPDWSRGYNLSKPLDEVLQENAESTENLALEMDGEFFKGQLRNGFFIEAGASNGEIFKGMNKKTATKFLKGDTDSHSLYLEARYNWTGLLVEPMGELTSKNRKAAVVPYCLAIKERPHYVEFEMNSVLGINPQTGWRAMGGIVRVSSQYI